MLNAIRNESIEDSSIRKIEIVASQVYNQDIVKLLKSLGFKRTDGVSSDPKMDNLPWDSENSDFVKTWSIVFDSDLLKSKR